MIVLDKQGSDLPRTKFSLQTLIQALHGGLTIHALSGKYPILLSIKLEAAALATTFTLTIQLPNQVREESTRQ